MKNKPFFEDFALKSVNLKFSKIIATLVRVIKAKEKEEYDKGKYTDKKKFKFLVPDYHKWRYNFHQPPTFTIKNVLS